MFYYTYFHNGNKNDRRIAPYSYGDVATFWQLNGYANEKYGYEIVPESCNKHFETFKMGSMRLSDLNIKK